MVLLRQLADCHSTVEVARVESAGARQKVVQFWGIIWGEVPPGLLSAPEEAAGGWNLPGAKWPATGDLSVFLKRAVMMVLSRLTDKTQITKFEKTSKRS